MVTRRPARLVAAALIAALGTFLGPTLAGAQEFKQIALTDQHVTAFVAAQTDFAPLASKLLEGGDKPDEALLMQLEEIAKKHGFKNFAEYEDVGANITIVLDGLDRKSGVYTDPIEKMKHELADIEADSSIPEEDRKLAVEDLKQEIAAAQPLQFKDNIEVVKRHSAEIAKLLPDYQAESDGDSGGGAPEPAPAPSESAPAGESK